MPVSAVSCWTLFCEHHAGGLLSTNPTASSAGRASSLSAVSAAYRSCFEVSPGGRPVPFSVIHPGPLPAPLPPALSDVPLLHFLEDSPLTPVMRLPRLVLSFLPQIRQMLL